MLVCIPDETSKQIATLRRQRDDARRNYFRHADPGGLTPAEKTAWNIENLALALLVQAAELRLTREQELMKLLRGTRGSLNVK